MKILIVDDEKLARERLCDLVREIYPDSNIFESHNGLDALTKITDHLPEIILLDIRMPGMDGLELANHLLHFENPPAVIFTTAYQDHAIKAFDANAVDYLLKPIRKDRLHTAIERASAVTRNMLDKLSEIDQTETTRKHLSALVHGDIQLVLVDDIYFLKAEQKYVIAAWPEGELLLDESLVSLEAEFSHKFIRIHRNALVAKNKIDSLCKTDDGQQINKNHQHGYRIIRQSTPLA